MNVNAGLIELSMAEQFAVGGGDTFDMYFGFMCATAFLAGFLAAPELIVVAVGTGIAIASCISLMDLIRIDRVVKNHGHRFRLGPLDLRLKTGEVLGIMGPNGAGKTTLLRLIWGFLRPDQGSVSVFQVQPHLNQVSVRLRAGYLSESPHFYGWMTARKHLEFVSEFYHCWNAARVSALLSRFGIDPGTPVQQLSRGNRIKLGLVSAAGHDPFLLLLDEPTAGLDPLVRRDILSFLRSLSKEHGVGIVLSSHISDDLDQLADSVLMLNAGRIMEYAPTSVLLQKYQLARLEDIFLEAVQTNRVDIHKEGLG